MTTEEKHECVMTERKHTADGKEWIVCSGCGSVVVPSKTEGWKRLELQSSNLRSAHRRTRSLDSGKVHK